MIVLFLYSKTAIGSGEPAEAGGGIIIIVIIERPHRRITVQRSELSLGIHGGGDQDKNSPLRATMFHAVGLKAIEAKEQYKEGFEKSTCCNRMDMVVYTV